MISRLESRRLLAVTVGLSAGKLSITGTPAADVISVNLSGGQIKVVSGPSTSSFLASAVQSIYADLLGGNDKLTISTAITLPTSLIGGAGNDSIFGGGGNDVIRGAGGNDSLVGNAGNDLLDGNLDQDALYGGKGNDTFTSGTGDDYIDGGDGSDTVDYSARLTPVHFHLYFGQINADEGSGGEGAENDTFKSIETGIGGHSDDTLGFTDYGYSDSDPPLDHPPSKWPEIKLVGGPGNDDLGAGSHRSLGRHISLFGGSGNDSISCNQAGDDLFFYGDEGDDILNTTDGSYGYNGPDSSSFSHYSVLPVFLDGGSGNDLWKIIHRDYTDNAGFEEYGDTLASYTLPQSIENGYAYSDSPLKLVGNSSNNHLTAASYYYSTIIGGAGNDTLEVDNSYLDDNPDYPANSGPATLLGFDGNDSIIGSKFNDSIWGGDGSDTVDYSARLNSVNVQLTLFGDPFTNGDGGEGSEKDQYSDIETVIGGHADDTITLSHFVTTVYDVPYLPDQVINGNFKLIGGPGNDRLQDGGDGPLGLRNVTLDGGSGNDSIYAAQTPDVCYLFGGDGDDLLSTADGYPGYSGPDDQGDSQFLSMPKLVNGGSGIDLWDLGHIDQLNSNGETQYYDNPITYTLPDSVENASVDSDSSIKFIGNGLDNHITISSQFRSTLLGMAGNDTLEVDNRYYSEDHPEYGSYNNGPATILGGDGDDRIIGSKFSDLLDGQSGNDFIDGQAGNDILTGGLGTDSLFGNLGNDTFYSNDNTADLINGGPGTDKARSDPLDQLKRVEALF